MLEGYPHLSPYAVRSEPAHENIGCFRVRRREQAALLLNERHLRSESGEGLRQLDSNRPSAQDEQPLGQLLEVEDLLVGDGGHRFQAGHWRALRHGTGADNEVARLDAPPSHLYACMIQKARFAELDIDPASSQLLRRLERVHRGDRLPDAPHYFREVDPCACGASTGV